MRLLRHLSVLLLCATAVPALAQSTGDSDQDPQFDVFEYRVAGNSVLANAVIERAVYPFLGPAKTIDDVEQARTALAEAYRAAGYNAALVTIPEQSVDAGIVVLRVTEGRLGRIHATQARYTSGRDLVASMASLEPGEAVNFPALQDDLAAANALSADRAVTPIIKPGRRPGELDVELRVDDGLPVHASVAFDDRFIVDTEELRATATLSYDNLFQRFHSLSLQYNTAPERTADSTVWALSYLWRLQNDPGVLAFYAVDTSSDVVTVGDLNVLGAGRIYGFRFVRPLESQSNLFHSLTVGADYKDIDEVIGAPDSDDPLTETPITYTLLSGNYQFGWNFEEYRSNYNLGIGLGVRGFGNDVQEFEDKRFNARPNFFYLRVGMEQLLRGPGGIGLYGRLNGQYSPEPLIGNEQIAAGGVATVRGYLEAERLGDYGASGTFELRTPNFGPRLADWINTFYMHAFYDAAQLGLQDALPGQDPHFELYSTGVGLRFNAAPGIQAEVDYAHPLRDSVNVQAGDERFHFALRWAF